MIAWLKSLDLVQGILPGRFSRTARGQGQAGTVVGPTQRCGPQQESVAQGLKRSVLTIRGQAESPDPDEASGMGPPHGLRAARGDLDAPAGTRGAQGSQRACERGGPAGDE